MIHLERVGGGDWLAKEGLLTIASDERSGKPAHSRQLAPHPLRPVFLESRALRGPVGSITPRSSVHRPYAKASPDRRDLKSRPGALDVDEREGTCGLQALP
jgi:hypothetical protein